MSANEFPTFYTMARTNASVEVPKLFAHGYKSFTDFMEYRGWTFTEVLSNDFELSTTYKVRNSKYPEHTHPEWDSDLAEYQTTNLRTLVMQLYKEKGLVTDFGKALPLCDHCSLSGECYKGNEQRKPTLVNPDWSQIELPWIGKNYYKNKIVILGINPNEDGGLNELYSLIDSAKSELLFGKTKVNFNYTYEDGKKYKGTYLWHRIAAYSKIANGALRIDKEEVFKFVDLVSDESMLPQNVADQYDNIAFLNHIKCSPLGERSKPTNKMWENCGNHILLEELKILRPNWLIVLGTGDNTWALNNNIMTSNTITNDPEFKCFITQVFGTRTKVVSFPHPAKVGGAKKDYYNKLLSSIQMLKNRH